MRIFVTGSNGFIGRAFCREALARGHQILGLVRNADAALPDGCLRVVGDLEELPWKAVEPFSPDTAHHLASLQ